MPSRSHRTFLLALLLASGMTTYYFALLIPQVRAVHALKDLAGGYYYGGDFYPIWHTAKSLQSTHSNPYTDAMTQEIQTGLYGRPLSSNRPGDPPPHYRAFSYPLYADILAWPLASLPFPRVQLLLGFAFSLLTAATLLLWIRGLAVPLSPLSITSLLLLYATSYPALEALFALQPTIVVAACVATMSAALAGGRYRIAGICLALAAIKPQLTILLTAWLVFWVLSAWRQRKGLLLSFAVTILLLLLASEFVLPGWFGLWRTALLDYRQYTEPPLIRLVLGRALAAAVTLFVLLLTVVRAWQTRHATPAQEDFSQTLALTLAVTVILLPTGGAVYEHILLLPALFWLYSHRQEVWQASTPMRWISALLLVVLLWQWILACAVAVAAWTHPAWRHSPPALLLPLRLAAPLPFVVLALVGMTIIRGWLKTPSRPAQLPSLA